jgi:hypothetical protein
MADTMGMADLRAEHIDSAVTGFVLSEYKLKPLCLIKKSSAQTESYYAETSTELTGGTGNAVRGVPRGADFPFLEASWTKYSSVQEKYAGKGIVFYEDQLFNNFDVISRTFEKIGHAVAYAVDIVIEASISTNAGNTFAITSGSEWDSATVANRDPISDLFQAIRLCAEDNYDVLKNGYLVVNPQDYQWLLSNVKVTNNPSFKSADVITNGVVGQLAGLKIVVSNAVTADQAYVLQGQKAVVWQEAAPLKVFQVKEDGIKTTISAFEMGVAQVTNPNAICKITNTRK